MVGIKRRRVAIEKIDSVAARNVCFSKRRKGLFKKAEQLSHLHPNVRIAAVVFSPAGTPFHFGDPSSLFQRFLPSSSPAPPSDPVANETNCSIEMNALLGVDVTKFTALTELQSYESDLRNMRSLLLTHLSGNKNKKDESLDLEKQENLIEENPMSDGTVEKFVSTTIMEDKEGFLDESELGRLGLNYPLLGIHGCCSATNSSLVAPEDDDSGGNIELFDADEFVNGLLNFD